MTVSPNDVLQVTARFLLANEDMQNVYHVQNTGVSHSDGGYDALITSWLDTAYTNLATQYVNDLVPVDIVIQNLTEGTPARYASWPTLGAGTDTNPELPYQVSALVNFPSAAVKRVGRKFISGFSESDNVEPGVPSSALLADLADFAADIIAGFVSGSYAGVPGNYNADTASFAAWIAANVATFWATQRRRRIGVGS